MVAGHLRKQNGIYQIILSYKDSDGKRKTKSISTGLPVKGNARNAEKMLQKARQEFIPPTDETSDKICVMDTDQPYECVASGNVPSAIKESSVPENNPKNNSSNLSGRKEGILFSAFLHEWLEMLRDSIDESTYGGYYNVIHNHIAPYFKKHGYTLADIENNPGVIQDYYTYELKTRGVSTNTVIHRHANIRKALQYAFQIGIIKSNPADRVIRPKKNSFSSDVYNEQELEQLFQVFHNDPLELAVILASYYGLRRSEIVGLKWNAIDFEQKTITIRHVVTEANIDGKAKLVIKDRPKTKASLRTLPLVPPFEALLTRLIQLQEENRRICGTSYCQDYLDYIYVNHVGELIKPGYITQHFPLILKKNNLKHIRFHDLRHSCASLLYANGVNIKDIQEWLGHSDISTTLNIYTHLNYKNKVASANAIASILPKPKEKELPTAAN